MRSIITGIVVLTVVGLVNAQNRRLVSNFNLSSYLNLASTDMGITGANDFINRACGGIKRGMINTAFNVETNETMDWEDYLNGPGRNGDRHFGSAIYPWSVVEGDCDPLLHSTWATDSEVVYSPYVKNTDLRAWTLPIDMNLVTPKSNVTTTLKSWDEGIRNVRYVMVDVFGEAHVFGEARPKIAWDIMRSMVWDQKDQTQPITKRIHFPECTQARLTAVSVVRTMIVVPAFTIKIYNYSVRREVPNPYNGGLMWETVEAQKLYNTWVDLRKDKEGKMLWVKRTARVWKTIYSSEGYVRVDGASLLLPGQNMIVQVEHQPLPPEECYHHH
jgi:hypothetical protein